jgi:hypothetical protein
MFSCGVCRNVGRTVTVIFFNAMLTAERGGGEGRRSELLIPFSPAGLSSLVR